MKLNLSREDLHTVYIFVKVNVSRKFLKESNCMQTFSLGVIMHFQYSTLESQDLFER